MPEETTVDKIDDWRIEEKKEFKVTETVETIYNIDEIETTIKNNNEAIEIYQWNIIVRQEENNRLQIIIDNYNKNK